MDSKVGHAVSDFLIFSVSLSLLGLWFSYLVFQPRLALLGCEVPLLLDKVGALLVFAPGLDCRGLSL